jgi:hypothetical protein
MKIEYQEKTFRGNALRIITRAIEILNSYARQGYDLTLRQLFYQFVVRAIIANSNREYKRLGSIVNDARLAGIIDWAHIVDRTRNMGQNSHWSGPIEIIQSCAHQFQIDKWSRQTNYVECWIEKDALKGLLASACKPLDVGYFSCRGYTSQSETWSAAMRLVEKLREGKQVHIVHLGDHDPSGIDMTRDIEARLNLFIGRHVKGSVSVNRVALNMDQIDHHGPPPNPTKVSDSRSKGYISRYGDKSWELDALEPSVIEELIRVEVLKLRDETLWEEAVEEEIAHQNELMAVAENWDALQARIRRKEIRPRTAKRKR